MRHTYSQWKAAGEPWTRCRPLADLYPAFIRRHGANTVASCLGSLGNEDHLTADPPEDHTPYSWTGYPTESPIWVVHALDWSGPGYVRQFEFWKWERQSNGGAKWLKYMNLLGTHYSWQPAYATRGSDDGREHGHASFYTGPWSTQSAAYGWPTVRPGDTGTWVRRLQAAANWHGARLAVDGINGPKTTGWIRGFQEHRGLKVDGIAGQITRTHLYVL